MALVWGEHLADIARALRAMDQFTKELNTIIPQGQPGHYSDLEFVLPGRVEIHLAGTPTGWALVWDPDVEGWMADFGEDD